MKSEIKRVLLVASPCGDHDYLKNSLEDLGNTYFAIHTLSDFGDALVYLNINQNLVDVCLLEYKIAAEDLFGFLSEWKGYRIRPLPIVVIRGDARRGKDTELIHLGVVAFGTVFVMVWKRWLNLSPFSLGQKNRQHYPAGV